MAKLSSDLEFEVHQLHSRLCEGLADPTRILILYALAEAPRNVSELAEALGSPQPTVSRHLKVLREREMVQAERIGPAIRYSLTDARLIEALDLLRAVLASRLKNRAALAETVESSEERATENGEPG
ncbi:MAG TPA: metalloregulator ArsR/SmtB family transcription factor [Anaerolineales bacterium]|nr:metalloregulator ArsR/SmtB family transcription factor [Anaerolineales bacterium]